MSAVHLCVEGTKGAGKTTTIQGVTERLRAEGWTVRTHALFHDGNDWATTQGFAGGVPMMESAPEPNERIVRWLLAREAAVREAFFREFSGDPNPALLVSDRGWITLHAYLYEGAWARVPHAVEAIDALWFACIRDAPPTVFIHTPPEVSAARRQGALDAVSGLQTDQRLRDDYDRRIRVAQAHPEKILDAWETGTGPFVDLAPRVADRVRAMR